MSPEKFLDNFRAAPRGTYVPYAVNVSCICKTFPTTGGVAWKLYKDGMAALFQRRHSRGEKSTFDYLAFKL